MHNFIICGTQRTGTSLLNSSLRTHPGIRCYSEVFLFAKGRGINIEGSYRRFVDEKSMLVKIFERFSRSVLVEKYLDELFGGGAQATGFKLMLGQIKQFPSIADYMRTRNISAIHVVRENVLKTHISRLSAKQRQLYHAKENVKVKKIILPAAKLQRDLGRIEAEKAEWRRYLADVRMLEVQYEAMLKDRPAVMANLQRFLSVDAVNDLSSSLLKINPDSLEDIIENYGQVKERISGTRFEKYLG